MVTRIDDEHAKSDFNVGYFLVESAEFMELLP
jgi:hypothetical protein